MTRPKTKRRTNGKTKSTPNQVIRTDVWQLAADDAQKKSMMLTVQEYRAYLRPLVLIVNAGWVKLAGLNSQERVNAVEKWFMPQLKFPILSIATLRQQH